MTTAAEQHPRVLAQFPKLCGCKRVFGRAEWAGLKKKGEWSDEYERIELKDCACGSTLAVLIAVFKEEEE